MSKKGRTSTGGALWIKVVVVSTSFLLLLSSLTQNAYYVEGSGDSVGSFGLVAFLLGWVNMLEAGISWLANPILLVSWVLLFGKKRKASTILSLLAVAFALSFLLFDRVVANEGGGKREIVGYAIGYWLWLSSCAVNLIGNLLINILSNKKTSPPDGSIIHNNKAGVGQHFFEILSWT